MKYIKYFAFGISIGVSGLAFGSILARGITLYQERIDIIFTKK